MNRIAAAVVAALLVVPLTGASAPAEPAPIRAKLRAPVVLKAKLAEGTGQVTVRFERAATAVRVEVTGLDGLTVTSAATPVDGASFERGAEATFDVAFTPGPGRSFLRVAVSGEFGAGPRVTAVSFPIGERSADAPRKANGRVVETPSGERVKVLPSGK